MNILMGIMLIPSFTCAMEQHVDRLHTVYPAQDYAACTTSVTNKKLALMRRTYQGLHIQKTDDDLKEMLSTSQELEAEMRMTSNTGYMPRMAENREEYINEVRKYATRNATQATQEPKPLCAFCSQFSRPQDDDKNYIWRRSQRSVVMFNLNPYQLWHLLVIPFHHAENFENLSYEESEDLFEQAKICMEKSQELSMHGFEFYFNLAGTKGAAAGRCAGKSMDHIHGQLLARWPGDKWGVLSYLIGVDILRQERNLMNDLWQSIKYWDVKKLEEVYKPYGELLAFSDKEEDRDCYVCTFLQNKENDTRNLVIHRFDDDYILRMLRFGYCGGHLSLYKKAHGDQFSKLNKEELGKLAAIITTCQLKLKEEMQSEGLNIVITEGACAGSTCKDHVYCQMIPRYNGDTSAGAVVQQRPVMDKKQADLHDRLAARFDEKK